VTLSAAISPPPRVAWTPATRSTASLPWPVSDPAPEPEPRARLEVNVLGMYNIVELPLSQASRRWCSRPRWRRMATPRLTRFDERTPFSWQTAPPALALYARARSIGENLFACISSGTARLRGAALRHESMEISGIMPPQAVLDLHVRVPVLNTAPNSWFSVFTRVWSSKCGHVCSIASAVSAKSFAHYLASRGLHEPCGNRLAVAISLTIIRDQVALFLI